MPLTSKGEHVMSAMKKEYGGEKGEEVFYASKNKGTISGVDGAVKEPNDKDFAEHQRMVQKMNQQQREFIRNKQTGRSDELSPLADRIDALSQRADGLDDRAHEAARQDAVRVSRECADNEGENQRQQPRRDAEGEVTVTAKAHNPATGKVDKEVTYKARNMAEAQNWAKFNKDYMQDFKFKRSDAEGEYLRQRKDAGRPAPGGTDKGINYIIPKEGGWTARHANGQVGPEKFKTREEGLAWLKKANSRSDVGFNLAEVSSPAQNESIPDDRDFADPWIVQFQDPEGYSNPPAYTVRATDRDTAVKKAREMLSTRWAENSTQRNRAKTFTLKSVKRP
jgi:hypothetical protein